jgi:hypothetical protein
LWFFNDFRDFLHYWLRRRLIFFDDFLHELLFISDQFNVFQETFITCESFDHYFVPWEYWIRESHGPKRILFLYWSRHYLCWNNAFFFSCDGKIFLILCFITFFRGTHSYPFLGLLNNNTQSLLPVVDPLYFREKLFEWGISPFSLFSSSLLLLSFWNYIFVSVYHFTESLNLEGNSSISIMDVLDYL